MTQEILRKTSIQIIMGFMKARLAPSQGKGKHCARYVIGNFQVKSNDVKFCLYKIMLFVPCIWVSCKPTTSIN